MDQDAVAAVVSERAGHTQKIPSGHWPDIGLVSARLEPSESSASRMQRGSGA